MPSDTKKNILYISYDGMTDPLGQSQVIPYLKGLSSNGYAIHLLSFEKPERYQSNKEAISEILTQNNIKWIPFRYHKRFSLLATSYDLFRGFLFLLFYVPKHNIKLVHCRSYISSVLGMWIKKVYGAKFIFDMRGFWADERIEGGLIKKGRVYYALKSLEKKFMLNADATISLTKSAIEEMNTWPYLKAQHKERIHHITTCCDINAFNETFKHNTENNSPKRHLTFTYIGSIGPWHSFSEITGFVDSAYHHVPNSTFNMIINWGIELFEEFVKEQNYDTDRFNIRALPHREIPNAIKDSDIGFFFVPPVYAKMASSPTKMGEMLSAGMPIISGHSIGDVDQLTEQNNIGAIVRNFEKKEYVNKIDHVIQLIQTDKKALGNRCLEVAKDYFSLDKGVKKYGEIYQNLLNG